MNTVKKNGGFTLVELIIVIAILAILSSVAVAGYSSYIKKANNSAVESFMNNVVDHAVLANAEAGDVGDIVFANDSTNAAHVFVTIKAGTPGFDDDFETNFETAFGVTLTKVDENSDGVAEAYTFKATNVSAWKNSDYAGQSTTK